MKLSPYLNFNGNCAAALKFYEQVLGGTLASQMTYGESPMAEQTPAEWHDKIIHAHLIVGGTNLMAADAPPDYFEPAKGTSVLIELPTLEEAERIFAAFAEGGTVTMPLQATFWSPGFGMVTDQFGTPWMLNCD